MNKYEIDKNWFINNINNKNLIEKLQKIKVIITDIDGCLTNANLLVTENNIGKSFSVQDGFGTSTAIKNKLIDIAFLTGRTDEATKIRAKMLGIPDELCFTGIDQKKIAKIKAIQKLKNITKEETLYFGDDLLDFEALDAIGVMASPENTVFYFQDYANIIVPRTGGDSAFRLLLDLVLYAQNKHFAQEFIDKTIK
ncbi:MAG: 3-deoxy-D-manno-octulosonate 8-phosphate phosphatase [candidate division TM6 bacterium GW2011_GWF2_28_16]|nr:MAG: 3-deoxy-D-manno-octulosonate 8-phosphate phosphatase [candidate division TM6 bacterium GW2011_GWF2_28_16]